MFVFVHLDIRRHQSTDRETQEEKRKDPSMLLYAERLPDRASVSLKLKIRSSVNLFVQYCIHLASSGKRSLNKLHKGTSMRQTLLFNNSMFLRRDVAGRADKNTEIFLNVAPVRTYCTKRSEC